MSEVAKNGVANRLLGTLVGDSHLEVYKTVVLVQPI
jgi:hypothetical protein